MADSSTKAALLVPMVTGFAVSVTVCEYFWTTNGSFETTSTTFETTKLAARKVAQYASAAVAYGLALGLIFVVGDSCRRLEH